MDQLPAGKRIAPDEEKLTAELNVHWEVVSEGAQTILRAAGQSNAYESLKEQTRGRTLTAADYKAWVESVEVSEKCVLNWLHFRRIRILGWQ
ncbi:MAG: hypothetical protein IPO22_08625 [Anaerolineales bacterium]|nr:hypothetical protein [Anaerolineales bacterium]